MARGRVRVVVGVEGVDDMTAELVRRMGAARAAAEEQLGREAKAVADDMRRNAPRRTGELRRGIVWEHRGDEAVVRSTARHSRFIEFGTRKVPRRPYVRPAALRSERRLPKRISTAVREVTEG